MAEEKKTGSYDAGCHCGNISFTFKLSPPLEETKVVECNCSICRRCGYLLLYPLASDVTWHNDSKARLSIYQFNTKQKDQLFCGTCGSSIGIDFRDVMTPHRYGFSARTIHGINLKELQYRQLDGVNMVGPAEDLTKRHDVGAEGAPEET